MKKIILGFAFISLSTPIFACSPIWVEDQIMVNADFLKKIQNMDYGGEQKCEALRRSDGAPAIDIQYRRSDENRKKGTVVRNFRAHLLCTNRWAEKPFYDYVEGKARIRFKLYLARDPRDSCHGTVFQTLKSLKF